MAVPGPQARSKLAQANRWFMRGVAHGAPGPATGVTTDAADLQESAEHLCITLAGSAAG